MIGFEAVLMRERFDIGTKGAEKPHIALGNRLHIKYTDKNQKTHNILTRAQNMHIALRVAGSAVLSYYDYGELPESGRNRFNWRYVVNEAMKDFEKQWNPDCWVALYQNGEIKYETNEKKRHGFLDIVEQVADKKPGNYEQIIKISEGIFKKANPDLLVDHDCDKALTISGDEDKINCYIIYRTPETREEVKVIFERKQMKHLKNERGPTVKPNDCLNLVAAIMEGFQLGFIVGNHYNRFDRGELNWGSKEMKQCDQAIRRVYTLTKYLQDMEQKYTITYKPNFPKFEENMREIEKFFQKIRT